MNTQRNKYYLLNIVFVGCLALLVVNDYYLKHAYAGMLTGKLSDIAGIILLPLLLAYLFPAIKNKAPLLSGLFFIFWKSPFSQGFIDVYNRIAIIPIDRVIDHTDLLVLCLLPVPYMLIRKIDDYPALKINGVHSLWMLLPTVFALMATSVPASHYYHLTTENMQGTGWMKVRGTQEEIVKKLAHQGIVFDSIRKLYYSDVAPKISHEDSIKLKLEPGSKPEVSRYTLYKMNRWVIGRDTLQAVELTMKTKRNKRTYIHFRGMHSDANISNYLIMDTVRTYYWKVISGELKRATAK